MVIQATVNVKTNLYLPDFQKIELRVYIIKSVFPIFQGRIAFCETSNSHKLLNET